MSLDDQWDAETYIDSYVGLGYVRGFYYERNKRHICEPEPFVYQDKVYQDDCQEEVQVTRDSKLNIIELPLSIELRVSWLSVNFETGFFYGSSKHKTRDTIKRELNYEIGVGTHYYF